MITCTISNLLARCKERGYTLDEVRPCIVSEDGDIITVDETHTAYPRRKIQVKDKGTGTELKKLLSKIGIKASPTCSCNTRAKIMDENGIDWCAQNIETIVGWLQEEAEKRQLPFIAIGAKLLVKRAIAAARKAEKKALHDTTPSPSNTQARSG
jgi:hypothetical protein